MQLGVRHRRLLLAAGLVTPLLGLGCIWAAMIAYPGFNHAVQYLSELGSPKAPLTSRAFFNLALVLTGLGAVLAAVGEYIALTAVGGRRLPAALIALLMALGGIGLVVGAIFVIPDPRHRWAVNMGLGVQLCPLLLFWCLWGVKGFARLRVFLALVLVAMAALTLLTHHMVWPGLVNDDNVGWWETVFATVIVSWVAVVSIALDRRCRSEGVWGGRLT